MQTETSIGSVITREICLGTLDRMQSLETVRSQFIPYKLCNLGQTT